MTESGRHNLLPVALWVYLFDAPLFGVLAFSVR